MAKITVEQISEFIKSDIEGTLNGTTVAQFLILEEPVIKDYIELVAERFRHPKKVKKNFIETRSRSEALTAATDTVLEGDWLVKSVEIELTKFLLLMLEVFSELDDEGELPETEEEEEEREASEAVQEDSTSL